jgi:UDP-2,3-diacylglucosamine pyrophosphatase LpxH
MPNSKYRSIFISDIHLGSRACQAELLTEFLKHNTCQNLYLVGDIFDLWKLKSSKFWPQTHSNVVRRLLTAAKRGTRVRYVLGNHDESLRAWLPDMHTFGNIELGNAFEHYTVHGQRFLVTHGDLFDGVIRYHKWLSILGDKAHSFVLWVNTYLNYARKFFGKDYWSLSSFLKTNTKQAVAFITKYEQHLIQYARDEAFHGVICGHIHSAALKTFDDGFAYMNCGDFCETVSALVENFDGSIELLVYDTQTKSMMMKNKWSIQ